MQRAASSPHRRRPRSHDGFWTAGRGPGSGRGPRRGWGRGGARSARLAQAASRDWERGRSKNVPYSSVFLPGPAPPLPPNKPFPIAQLADGRPLAPSQGSGPDPPLRGRPLGRPPAPLPQPGDQGRAPAPSLPHPPPRRGGPWPWAAGVSWGPGPEPSGPQPGCEAPSVDRPGRGGDGGAPPARSR